ncbi:sensor histidine kinase [Aureibaculum sp. 2210JD6-5]|uniref:sensor histidine kinase n=1 Tax=Aureibaculum sp. 2210JD6-5 TaxID=3103957 RepID=UPI002AAC67BE|nr:sensor histidine kinase [Aureibaculum sp. 2210JD6-5]MDY7395586.1 sensor histidine kinase [Aureibaculum sp. 2210JD6-5]
MSLINLNNISNSPYHTRITWKYHVVFWLAYFTVNTLRWGSYYDDYLYSLRSNLVGFPIHMTLCYLNVYVLMPFLVFRRKYLMYILAIFASIFIMVTIKFNLTYYFLNTNVWPEGPVVTNSLTFNYVVDMMIGELYVITFVTAIKITMDWLTEHKRLTDLEKLQLETELLFLKTQVSPHFFFNTLNNIYSLSIEKSEKTPKIILKLSELMRYLLYETKKKRQSLEKEIICLQNYLEIERIRHGEGLEVNMEISGDISGKKIAPILLLSFVENAFKHGANKNIGKVKIDIDFKIKEDFLFFTITNPTPAYSEYEQRMNTSGGIGLKNVKKRLALGYKKDQYDLKIKNDQNLFTVKLKIKVQ